MPDDVYEKIAPYYDLLHQALTADIGFVLALAGQAGGPVLELGCGTGRLLIPLARAGHRVTGVDSGMEMLARARIRLATEPNPVQARVQLVRAEMETVALAPESYRLALIPYNTFLHLPPGAAVAACQNVATHLVPGALFFLDLPNPHLLAQTPDDRFLTLEQTLTDPESGDLLLVLASNRLEEVAQQLHITWLYDLSPVAGGPLQRTVVQITYHYYFLHQLELLLAQAGFTLEAVYGDYNHLPFAEDSERLLLVARKPPLSRA